MNYDQETLLFWLEPINKHATEAVQAQPPGRRAEVQANGVWANWITIRLQEPRQRKGHVTFGRDFGCTIRFPKAHKSVSGLHCYIDINSVSGELVLYAIASQPTTWLDGEQISIPRFRSEAPNTRAMVYGKCKRLQIAEAAFHIVWPRVEGQRLDIYRLAKLAYVGKNRHPEDDDELTDFEFALNLESACSTRAPTRPLTRQLTPFGIDPAEQGPIQIKQLGSGAYGTVHLAIDRFTADFVAVKSFKALQGNGNATKEAEARQEFIRELTAMRGLNHSNIVQLKGWRELDSGRIEIDLQYCSRGSLRNVWEETSQKLNILWWDVAQGLTYLHTKGMIHRDIKPENILVHRPEGGDDCFKLADFGKSKEIRRAQTVCGTPYYMAPEIFQNEEESQSAKMDVYALGVIFFEFAGCLKNLAGQIRKWSQVPKIPGIIRRQASLVTFQDNEVGDFLRSMIQEDRFHRPDAYDCVNFVSKKWTDLANRMTATPKMIDISVYQPNTREEEPKPARDTLQAERIQRRPPALLKPRVEPSKPVPTYLVNPAPQRRQYSSSLHIARPPAQPFQHAEKVRQAKPSIVQKPRDEVPSCLRARKTEDKVKKKSAKTSQRRLKMPGGWDDLG